MDQEEWQNEHFNNRRIAHGRKGKHGGRGSVFDERRAYGLYQLRCAAFAQLQASSNHMSSKAKGAAYGHLEIHGPADCHEHALMCTLEFPDVLSGVALLTGSRKSLASAVREMEEIDDDDDDAEGYPAKAAETAGSENGESIADDEDEDEDEDEEDEQQSPLEREDERERTHYEAFEKNAFRSPKFWMRWRALILSAPSPASTADGDSSENAPKQGLETIEVNGGYIVFTGNECAKFQGTISCDRLGWTNVKLSGSKILSKARESHVGWSDVVAPDHKG